RLAGTAGCADVFWSCKHRPFGPLLPSRAEGLAILSRHPLDDATVDVLPPRTLPWTYRRRIVQYARIPKLGVVVANVHLASDGWAAVGEAVRPPAGRRPPALSPTRLRRLQPPTTASAQRRRGHRRRGRPPALGREARVSRAPSRRRAP